MSNGFIKYGKVWSKDYMPIDIELACIAMGGTEGRNGGVSLFDHYMAARKLLWPHRYRHRWTDLMYHSFIDNQVTILMGSGSSQKTSHASEFALISYWARPQNTLVLLSTTSVDKLEGAIFGEAKMLFRDARKLHPHLSGTVFDSRHAITTDALRENANDLDGDEVRDMRRGVVGKACYVGSKYVGLGVFAGIKQEYVIFIGDELQFMPSTFLDCLPNMFQNPNVKVIGSGNTKHDKYDMLSKAAEPRAGWDSLGKIEKTTTWQTRFQDGVCINLVGTDSPNFDVPKEKPIPYPRLVNWKTCERVAAYWGKDSLQYFSQCVGTPQWGMMGSRVVTEALCKSHRALEKAVWMGADHKMIAALDPAWTADGDRCVLMMGEIGTSSEGVEILRVLPPAIIPIIADSQVIPEDQIAQRVKQECASAGVASSDIFYDSFGRGTLGAAFARTFGSTPPVPVDAGGKPTKRPVRHDLFVNENNQNRLKRCDEHYSKHISELWFSVRYAIECDQVRELPDDVMEELCMREYGTVAGSKLEVEAKEDTKERMGKSPDLGDCMAILVEGARQRGFKIRRLGAGLIENEENEDDDWFYEEEKRQDDIIKGHLLQHV